MQNIEIKHIEQISILKINREKQLNSLNKGVIDDLVSALSTIKKNKNIKCVIITGSGEKAFVAGADIKEFYKYNKEDGAAMARENQKRLFDLIENFTKPVIAMINGYALGGGLELALSCHIRTGSSNSIYGFPEVKLGLIPGYGGTQRISNIIGRGKAYEMIFSAQMINSEEAHRIKLINELYTQEELHEKTIELAKTISQNSPEAIKRAIKAINSSYEMKGFETEIKEFGECFQTEDFIEGVSAFLEKRKPKFK
tara:strand:+ start:5078 stop:5842 length:765 start_codon:yes stop_codon:yes gene_type:complete